jgi:hypothetical protein
VITRPVASSRYNVRTLGQGLVSVADMLNYDNDNIFNALIDDAGLESTVLARDDRDAER